MAELASEAAAAAAAAAAAEAAPHRERLERAVIVLAEARSIASEPEHPLVAPIFAAMAAEGAEPPAVPIPPEVAAKWQSDPSFAARVVRLEAALVTHAVRSLLACGVPPFRDDVMRGVHAVYVTALDSGDFALAEAACRHLLGDLRARATFAHTRGATGRPTAPLYALQLVPLADLYAQWAKAVEVAAAAAAPGVGQAAAAQGRAAPLQPAPLPPQLRKERDAVGGAFFCPPGPGGAGEPLGVWQGELSSTDLRVAAAALYAAAAESVLLAFGPQAPHGEHLRRLAAAVVVAR